MKSKEFFKTIQKEIVTLMKTEGMDWSKSWVDINMEVPQNYFTGRHYRGINTWWLDFITFNRGYECNGWATFKQWSDAGCKIKKGEKGTSVHFLQIKEKKLEWLKEDELARYKKTGKLPTYWQEKIYYVFNENQIEDSSISTIKPKYHINQVKHSSDLTESTRSSLQTFIANTEAFINDWNTDEVNIDGSVIKSDRAYYSPKKDMITMPLLEAFHRESDYYSVLLHELAHWTMHKDRLDRDLPYAEEELVAEISSCFLSRLLGVEKSVRPNHAKYLNNWITAIEEDERALQSAFSKAQKVVDYLYGLQEEKQEVA
tara:strand:+ start:6208 stop:7152 length:945 start_codon:yes stop_codon:yes gene_type:complete